MIGIKTQNTRPGKAWRRRCLGGVLLLCALLPFVALTNAQQVYREGFEGREVLWTQGKNDAEFRETSHKVTEETAHEGQRSEEIKLDARQGSFIHYYHDIGRAPISEELIACVWVKANRPGVQLLARLVFPQTRNAKNPEEVVSTIVLGDKYTLAGRWQRLEIRRPTQILKDQQQLLRVALNQDIKVDGAYLDRLVLNVYGGPGLTEVYVDDLEIGPVLEATPLKNINRPTSREGNTPAPNRRAAVVELNRDQLKVNGKKFFIRATRHTDAPLKVLRDAGFNVLCIDETASAALVEEAANQGFWLVPTISATQKDRQLTSSDALSRTISHFVNQDAVLFWDMGSGLATEQLTSLTRTAQQIRSLDSRPLAADVWDGFQPYSRNVDMLGVHRWPLMTGLELSQYRTWLNQRRLLAQPGTFFWTWVQTHVPDWYKQVANEQIGVVSKVSTSEQSAAVSEIAGPQPEQIRLLTYTALSAGCRGLGFWTDRFVADAHGRDRLLTLALLNQELQMLEPLLVTAEPPQWIDTSAPEVKAALMRTEHGILVMPIWVGPGSQFVPGQAAAVKLSITVPQVPNGVQAWEVSPGEVRSLQSERVVGGTKVTLPEFGLTSAIVFTSDNGPTGLIVRFQNQTARLRKMAAQWSHDLAQLELDKVSKTHGELEQASHSLPDGQSLLDDSRKRLQSSARHYNNGDYRESYLEAQRALRPLRILMRAQWDQATRELDAPVASAYAVNFFTLPKHWQFADQVRQASAGANLLTGGDFEQSPNQGPFAWLAQEVTLDEVELMARRVTDDPHGGKQCLMLQVTPKNKQTPPAALERTFLAIHSPAVRLEPGTLVRISGWIRIPGAIGASADGALLYDSAGGEPLAIRLTEPTNWKKFTLYRRVPASGNVSMTVALTGLGKVYFDDLQIEPLSPGTAANKPTPLRSTPETVPGNTVSRPGSPRSTPEAIPTSRTRQ